MQNINQQILLEAFKKTVQDKKVTFIKQASVIDNKNILSLIDNLLLIFDEAGADQIKLDWAQCHNNCASLWKILTRLSLYDIDHESKGNAKLSEFLEEATKFEEVLYGLDEFYRDHTLHSLWVYLLGDYLLRGQMKKTYNDLNWHLFNDVENEAEWKHLKTQARKRESELCKQVNEKKDAIWCLIALCHDLGYPLSKLGEINKRVGKVLNFFDFHSFEQVGYSLRIEHQYLTKQFLELMSDDIRIQATTDEKDIEIKLFRDDGAYWRHCDSLERREHGTLSSLILFKLLGIFGDATLRGPAVDWGLEDAEAVDTLIRGMILYAIAQHDLEYNWANELGSLSDLLFLADEVEEFARWSSRPLKTRNYLPTIAEVSLGINYSTGKGHDWVDVNIEYKVNKDRDIYDFFTRKAKRITEIYHLVPAESTARARVGRPRIGRFPNIKTFLMIATNEQATLEIKLDKDGKITGKFPDENSKKIKKHNLVLENDNLFVSENKKLTPLIEMID